MVSFLNKIVLQYHFFSLDFNDLTGSYKLIVVLFTSAIDIKATKNIIGTGCFNSFIMGLRPVRDLAQRLQIPIAVALFSIGNILLSMKHAKYDDKKPIATPYLESIMQIGIHLLKNKSKDGSVLSPVYISCIFSRYSMQRPPIIPIIKLK